MLWSSGAPGKIQFGASLYANYFSYRVFFKLFNIIYINRQCHQDVAESILVTVGSL